jgi:3-hydroxyisobutyrate dehydrogenase
MDDVAGQIRRTTANFRPLNRSDSMTIGLIGIGNMGRNIAEHLVDEGQALLLWNRTRAKAESVIGAQVADRPVNVAQGADIILSILANDGAIDTVYKGPGGILEADLTGKTVVEMCTTSPETATGLEQAVQARGGLFLECPVGGNTVPARSGQLLGLAGGSDAAFGAAKPVLDRLTRRLEHLGPVGTGAAMKLAINLPLMVYWSALGEALGLVLKKGIDPEKALDILADTSGAIGAAKKRVPPIYDMLVNDNPGPVGLSLANGIKDMRLMVALAQANGHDSPVVSGALARSTAAADAGWAEYDSSLVGAFGNKTET